MVAHKTAHIRTSVGQVVTQMTVTIDGATVSVVPLSIAALRLAYSPRYVRMLCDSGQLIAIKISGMWFVLEYSVELFPQTDVLLPA